MGILISIGMWLLKVLLGGVFGRTMADIENKQEGEKNAALLHAETTREGSALEVDVVKKQVEVERAYKQPAPPADPFRVDAWNKSN